MAQIVTGQRVELGFKLTLLAVSLSLVCAIPLGKRNQAQAVEPPAPMIVERPSRDLCQRRIQASATDELTTEDQTEIRQIQASLPAADWRGSSFPVENLQTYTSAFGYRESPTGGYSQEFHYGLDMAAPEGSHVRNWWAGTVIKVSDDTSCGTSVVVQSGNWTATYYHMQGAVESKSGKRFIRSGDVQVQQGQTIPAGMRLGRVGMTGRTTGPHLHWTLKYANSYVDPGYVLRAMYQAQNTQ